jgi:hypothetical protein
MSGAEQRVTKWSVRTYGSSRYAHRGLAFGGDWVSVEHLAELPSGEDEGRVSVADVDRLLDIIEKGLG